MSTIKPGMGGEYDPKFNYEGGPVKGNGLGARKVPPSVKENSDMLAKAVFGKMQSPELEAFKKNIQFVPNKKLSGEQVVDKLVAYEKDKISKFVMKQDTTIVSGDDLYKQLFDVVLASKAPFKEMSDKLSHVTPKEIREHILIKVAEHIWQNGEKRWAGGGEDQFDNRRVLRRLGGEFQYAVRESSQSNHYTVAFNDSTGNVKEFRIKKMDLIAIVTTPGLSKEELINKLQGKLGEIFEETLQANGVWYDPTKTPQNPLLSNPSLKYSVRLSITDPESYGVGILVERGGKKTVEELRMKKSEFMELIQKPGMTPGKIAQEVQSRLSPKAKASPYTQLEADLRKIGRLYTHSEQNPLINAPQLKYSVRASSDPDSYAIGVVTDKGVQELRVKKSEFYDMVFNQKMSGEKIAEEIRARLSGTKDEGPDISASLEEIKKITTSNRDRLAKALELQKVMNSTINILLKDDPADKEKCLLLLATVLNCETSDVDAMKSGYRKLSLLVHPDRVKSSELFQLLSDLWEKSGMKENV